MELPTIWGRVAIVAAIVAGGCGVTVVTQGDSASDSDGDEPGCQEHWQDTDPYTELATAWIREPTDTIENAPWSPSSIPCDSNFVIALDASADGSLYVLGHAPSSLHCDDADRDTYGRCRATQWLRRLSPDYDDLWSRSFDLRDLVLVAVETTADGGAIVAGASGSRDNDSPWLARFGDDGSPLWQRDLTGSGHLRGLAVTPDGETVAVGTLDVEVGADLWVIKLRSDGFKAWSRNLGTLGYDAGTDVAVDAQGRIWVVGGWSSEPDTTGWLSRRNDGPISAMTRFEGSIVALLDPEGAELWIDESAAPITSSAGAYAVDLLPGGDAIVSAYSDDASLVRYNPSGERVWEVQTGDAIVRAVAVDDMGEIFAITDRSLFHFDSEGTELTAPQLLWESTDSQEVGMSDALTLKNDGTPLIAGHIVSGWIHL